MSERDCNARGYDPAIVECRSAGVYTPLKPSNFVANQGPDTLSNRVEAAVHHLRRYSSEPNADYAIQVIRELERDLKAANQRSVDLSNRWFEAVTELQDLEADAEFNAYAEGYEDGLSDATDEDMIDEGLDSVFEDGYDEGYAAAFNELSQ